MAAKPKPATKPRGRQPRDKALPKLPEVVIQQDLAKLLGLTTRRVQILTTEGVLVRAGRSEYPAADNVQRYLEFKIKSEVEKRAPASTDKLRERREEQIARRMAREDRDIISLAEAVEAVDAVTGAYLQSIAGLPVRVTRNVAERKRIEAICDDVRTELAESFSQKREALRAGRPAAEADEEDDA